MTACIGEPISWLRLEQAALGVTDAARDAHLAACPACRACLDDIRKDIVALPMLTVPDRKKLAWWRWAMPAMGLAAAAAILVLVLRPHARAEEVAVVKGVGDVEIGLVRERAGTIRDDSPTTFKPGDRWKVIVTCAPGVAAWLDVAVLEQGTHTPDYPIAPAHLTCGNRVVLPGAFTLTGTQPNRVCVYGAADERRAGIPDEAGCITVRPE